MARPLRLELAGALYHVTSHGVEGEDIYLSNDDRRAWLDAFAHVCQRFNWVCHAYCQMNDHYHLIVETPDANLSKGMRQLNGVYTQLFNRRHQRDGQIFQGRFKAIVVEADRYLLELARYVVLNPLRAKMVRQLENWPWSSYLATCGKAAKPEWLRCESVLSAFSPQRSRAMAKYIEFVHEGKGMPSVWDQVQGQIYLGSEKFVSRMRSLVGKQPARTQAPRAQQRASAKALADFAKKHERNEAIALAYLSGQHTMAAIGEHFGLHLTTVSRLVRAHEASERRGA